MALAATAAECGIAFWWLAGDLPMWAALAAHAGISIGLGVWSWRSQTARADIRLPLLLAVSTTALGPIGAAGTLLTIGLARWYLRHALPFEEWYRSIFPDTEKSANAALVEQIEGPEFRDTEPLSSFSDVLAFGSLRQKQDLVAFISRHFRPVFGPVLKRALNDGESVIRVQAATAMSTLENSLMERTLALTERVRQSPGDHEALRALASHYDTCLFSSILDPKREEELLSGAIRAYGECLSAEPRNSATRLAAGRLLLRSKRFREAAECFERAFDSQSPTSNAVLWYMESLFQLGKFEEIRRLARGWGGSPGAFTGFPAEALETVHLWAAPQLAPRSDAPQEL